MEKIQAIEKAQMKTKIADIRVGDTVRVHQKITEGKKTRIQVFEGLVIRYRKVSSLQAFITVRKITGGIGVEKSWFVHSPSVEKIQVVKRSKVRRAFLSYMRDRRGKSARMAEMGFDKDAVNESDSRTKDDLAKEEQEKIKKEEQGLDGDDAAADDVMNQPDTESLEGEVKKEQKQASQDDPTPASDNVPKDAPEQEKVNSDGNDEQQEAAEETNQGLDKKDK